MRTPAWWTQARGLALIGCLASLCLTRAHAQSGRDFRQLTLRPNAVVPFDTNGWWLGWSVATGDITGNGFDEIVLAAPNADHGVFGFDEGDIWVFESLTYMPWKKLGIENLNPRDTYNVGYFVICGDLNADGYDDLAANYIDRFFTGQTRIWWGPDLEAWTDLLEPGDPTGPFGDRGLCIRDYDGDGCNDLGSRVSSPPSRCTRGRS